MRLLFISILFSSCKSRSWQLLKQVCWANLLLTSVGHLCLQAMFNCPAFSHRNTWMGLFMAPFRFLLSQSVQASGTSLQSLLFSQWLLSHRNYLSQAALVTSATCPDLCPPPVSILYCSKIVEFDQIVVFLQLSKYAGNTHLLLG